MREYKPHHFFVPTINNVTTHHIFRPHLFFVWAFLLCFIINDLFPEGKNKVSCVKSREELLKEKKSVTDHACELLRRKYDIIVPPSDISGCHHMQSKNVLIKIWNRKEGSAWEKLSNQIKKGGRKEENIHANYMMFELRALKREGKLEKGSNLGEGGRKGATMSNIQKSKINHDPG